MELRYGARSLLQARSFSSLVVLTLALGIGATTAIFSVVSAVLLSPLPFADADRLVMIFQRAPAAGVHQDSLSRGQFRDIVEGTSVFEELAMMTGGPLLLTREGPPEDVGFLWARSSVLRMLGARPQLGRLLTGEDDRGGKPFVIVLSHDLWVRRYGGDPEIVGKTIGVEGFEVEVVGVLEPGFFLHNEVFSNPGSSGRLEAVLSLPLTEEAWSDRRAEVYRILGTLEPDATVAEAQAELDVVAARMLRDHPPNIADESFTLDAVPLLDHVVGPVRPALWMLLATAGALLLVACLNVSNLMLARAGARRRELGICAAIGAGRGRLGARLLGESVLLALAGAALGVGLAWFCVTALSRMGPASLPRLDSVGIDEPTLSAAILLAFATSLLSGLIPAWRFGNVDPKEVLTETSRGAGVLPKKINGAGIFVVAQVAMAFVLLVGAALVSRALVVLLDVDPGFEPRGTLAVRILEPPRNDADLEELIATVKEIPGAEIVATGTPLPFAPGAWWGPIDVEGHIEVPGAPTAIADRRSVSTDYFRAMGIPLLEGRTFERPDAEPDAPAVRIVDRLFAERFWPEESPVGKRVSQSYDAPGRAPELPLATVVGVVEHVRHYGLETDGRMTMYLPATELDRTYLVVRTDGDPNRLANAVVDAIRNFDPDIAVSDVRTMDGRLADAIAPRRLTMVLVHAFGWIALVIAAAGVFGLTAYGVAQGKREVGLRMVLGATGSSILGLVVRHGFSLVLLGVALGIGAAVVAGRLLAGHLFGVSAIHVPTYVLITLVMSASGLVACWAAARKTVGTHPSEALRR